MIGQQIIFYAVNICNYDDPRTILYQNNRPNKNIINETYFSIYAITKLELVCIPHSDPL